ncbi:MAG: hypothetical protein PHW60_10860 [Kiritimatiellae bacterium]|nr:hypothetical protein [Kiritimatiellia bacterium]
MADDFSTYYDEQLEGCYDCVDRIVVNAYYKMAQTPGEFRTWWRQLYDSEETLDRTHIMRMAGGFNRRLRGAAKKHQIPVVYVPMDERKDGIWEQYRPEASDFKGVFLVLVSRAPAPVWEVFRRKGRIVNIARKAKRPYVDHFLYSSYGFRLGASGHSYEQLSSFWDANHSQRSRIGRDVRPVYRAGVSGRSARIANADAPSGFSLRRT